MDLSFSSPYQVKILVYIYGHAARGPLARPMSQRAWASLARGTRPCLGRHPSPWHGPGMARQTGRPGARPGPQGRPTAGARGRGQRRNGPRHAPRWPVAIYKRTGASAPRPRTLTLIPFRHRAAALFSPSPLLATEALSVSLCSSV